MKIRTLALTLFIVFAVFSGGARNCPAGVAGYALQFDGVNDYVHIAASDELAYAGAMTLEAWVKIGTPRPDASFITRGDNTHDHGQYSLKLSPPHGPDPGRRLHLDCNDAVWDLGDEVFGSALLPLDEWVHVAAAFDGATARLYINGAIDRQQPLTVRSNLDSYDLFFGFDPPGWDEYFQGTIDEVRIWNIARTSQQIADWYDRTVPADTAGLVGYWDFNEGSGQIAHDLTANPNHGILGFSPLVDVSDPTWVASDAPIIVPEPNTFLLCAIVMGMWPLIVLVRRRTGSAHRT